MRDHGPFEWVKGGGRREEVGAEAGVAIKHTGAANELNGIDRPGECAFEYAPGIIKRPTTSCDYTRRAM